MYTSDQKDTIGSDMIFTRTKKITDDNLKEDFYTLGKENVLKEWKKRFARMNSSFSGKKSKSSNEDMEPLGKEFTNFKKETSSKWEKQSREMNQLMKILKP